MARLHADASGTGRSRLSLSWKLDRNATQGPIYSDPTGDSGQQPHFISK